MHRLWIAARNCDSLFVLPLTHFTAKIIMIKEAAGFRNWLSVNRTVNDSYLVFPPVTASLFPGTLNALTPPNRGSESSHAEAGRFSTPSGLTSRKQTLFFRAFLEAEYYLARYFRDRKRAKQHDPS
jgi:hypothetical protein